MRAVLLTVAIVLGSPIGVAAADPEEVDGSLTGFGYTRTTPGSGSPGVVDHTGTGVDYEYLPACVIAGDHVCNAEAGCFANGQEGFLYDVLLEGQVVGQVCVTEPAPGTPAVVTPGVVEREFRRLSWPGSELVVQPPKGRTLVNFATNFYTTNVAPTRQVVRLLGMRVVIEATPIEYVWQHGDGTSTATSDPGAAYPDLRVTHEYTAKGVVEPSVDTVYRGRYRVGRGPWVGIPETLTVAGEAQRLEVIEATPTLVQP